MALLSTDGMIRSALRDFIVSEEPTFHCCVIEEFGVFGGSVRADLAALGEISHGYEIKSCSDTLKRLQSQVEAYGAVFERATLVSSKRHLPEARALLPKWWGIVAVEVEAEGQVKLTRTRRSNPNPQQDRFALASLLWRDEALYLLDSLGLADGVRRKPMERISEQLAAHLDTVSLSAHVRQAIKARGDWRAGARRKRDGGTFRRTSSSSRFQCISSLNIA